MVPSVHLDLTSRGFGILRAGQWIMVVIIALAVAYTGWLWVEGRTLDQAAEPYETATQRVLETTAKYIKQARQDGADLSDERLKGLDKEVAFTNQMVAKHAFSWTRFLTDLEEAVPQHVSIASVGLSVKDGFSVITLTGAALDLRDLTALVNGLEGHAAFRNVVLAHHQVQTQAAPSTTVGGSTEAPDRRTVDFSLTVNYRPPL
jgi:hypothetical protein